MVKRLANEAPVARGHTGRAHPTVVVNSAAHAGVLEILNERTASWIALWCVRRMLSKFLFVTIQKLRYILWYLSRSQTGAKAHFLLCICTRQFSAF